MKRILTRVLLASTGFLAAAIALPAVALEVAQSTALRAYAVDFDGDGKKSLVYMNRKDGEIVVCDEGKMDACRTHHQQANDLVVVPARTGRGEQLLLIDACQFARKVDPLRSHFPH